MKEKLLGNLFVGSEYTDVFMKLLNTNYFIVIKSCKHHSHGDLKE